MKTTRAVAPRDVRSIVGPARQRAVAESHADHVRAYYEHTWYEFRGLWMNTDNRALHFGWWDPETNDHADSLVRMKAELAERAGIGDGDRCLDAGCGVGGTAMWLAQHRNADVVGITLVPDQARRAREYVEERGLTGQVDIIEGDYADTGLPSASFDVAYSQEAICHALDKRAVLAELTRLLKPGGRLLLCEYFLRDAEHARAPLIESWQRDWMMPPFVAADVFVEWARDLGLVEATVDDVTERVAPSLRRLHRISALLFPIESLLHRMRLRSDVQHANVRGSIRQWRGARDGLWIYGMFSARKPDSGVT